MGSEGILPLSRASKSFRQDQRILSKGQDNRQLNRPKVLWVNDDIELISLPTGIITISFVIHGSHNLEKVLNFTSRLEKSLNST